MNHQRYEHQFIYFCDEIIKNILNLKLGNVASVKSAVGRNRLFWDKQRQDILTEDQQVGLLCELEFLDRIIEINNKNMLQSWKGPTGFKYDFVFTDAYSKLKEPEERDIFILLMARINLIMMEIKRYLLLVIW